MITKSFRLEDLERVKICIGYVGENEHTQVRIDCSSAFAEYPGATPALAVKPPRGGVYPAVIETEGNVVVWTVTNSDLLFRGEGEIQFSFTLGDVIKKTAVGKFDVHRSIITTANVPDPVAEWLVRATAAAAAAEAAAQHQPKIEGEYWYVWDSDAEEYVSTGVKAKGDKGDPGTPGDPTTLIDDTSTALDKTWSAHELDGLKNAIDGIDNVVYKLVPDHDELVNIPLSFDSYGWYSSTRYYDTTDGKKAEVAVNAGEKYDVKSKSIWSFSPYVVIDSEGNILLSGDESGSGSYTTEAETITIPDGGVKLVFSAEAANTSWQNFCECKKHNIVYKKESALIVEINDQENIALSWTDGMAYLSNGNTLVDNGYSYDLIDVVPGDTYTFLYWSQWTITYVLFDNENHVLANGEVSDSATWKSYEETLTIPPTGRKLALSITSYRPSSQVTSSYLHHAYKQKVDLQEYMLNVLTQSNVLYGKKWFATGDSFTHGSIVDPDEDPFFESGIYMGKRKTYPYFIGLRNNMTIINDGLSGSTIAEIKSGDSYETTPFCDASRYQSIPEDTDYITLWFGINDANHCNLGTISDSTGATFYGAWNMVLDWIITNRPNAKIGIIITNLSTDTFREATREIAKKWGIPYLDMMGDYQVPVLIGGRETALGLDSDVADARTAHWHIASDNNHPTVAAHRYESTFIEAFLRRL